MASRRPAGDVSAALLGFYFGDKPLSRRHVLQEDQQSTDSGFTFQNAAALREEDTGLEPPLISSRAAELRKISRK